MTTSRGRRMHTGVRRAGMKETLSNAAALVVLVLAGALASPPSSNVGTSPSPLLEGIKPSPSHVGTNPSPSHERTNTSSSHEVTDPSPSQERTSPAHSKEGTDLKREVQRTSVAADQIPNAAAQADDDGRDKPILARLGEHDRLAGQDEDQKAEQRKKFFLWASYTTTTKFKLSLTTSSVPATCFNGS
ncbi:uncharacterized protein LOC108667342 [Hyalella azteca]|uniref:Uncharacterized protein LOC108667342 n=1 Tax=Hyalella azteca TaxID=294128 RepID=A0A979FVM8_HYAAZ|nr:uncharacterized protein LOC108667342 [Hyalella azteca]